MDAGLNAQHTPSDKPVTRIKVRTGLMPFALAPLAACGGGSGGGGGGETNTWPEPDPAPDPEPAIVSGSVVDGYVAGATVFYDENNNGVLDAGEVSTTTDANGGFTLEERNGKLIAIGGTDTNTGASLEGLTLSAPEGYSVITPLTTLLEHTGGDEAALKSSLGLPASLDLGTYDPVEALASDSANAEVYLEFAQQTLATVQSLAKLVEGSGVAANFEDAAGMVLQAIAEQIDGGAVDFSDPASLGQIIDAVDSGDQISAAATTAAAQAVAEVNAIVEGGGGVDTDQARAAALYAQTAFANDLELLGQDQSAENISAFEAENTGDALTDTVNEFVDSVPDGSGSQVVTSLDTVVTDEDHAISLNVLDNDQSLDGTALHLSSVTLDAQFTDVAEISFDENTGVVTVTPISDYSGDIWFSYVAESEGGYHATGHGHVSVSAVNDLPVIGAPAFTAIQGQSEVLERLDFGITDVDSADDKIIIQVSGVAHGQFELTGETATTFTLQNVVDGQVSFVHDGSDSAPTASFAIKDTAEGDFGTPVSATIDFFALLEGTSGDDILAGGAINDVIYGYGGDDQISGNGGNDTLDGGDGDDILNGGGGDDLLIGGGGTDAFYGGDGIDTVDLSEHSFSQDIDLAAGNVSSNVNTEILDGIENAIGGSGNDILVGDSGDNRLEGGLGDDWIIGGSGRDTAVFSGARSGYNITVDEATGRVFVIDQDISDGDDGDDVLDNIELLEFSDQTIEVSQSNSPPQLANAVADPTAVEDEAFNFAFPSNTFTDPDGDVLDISVTLADGTPIPHDLWLQFSPQLGQLVGTPTNDDVGTVPLKVTASDGEFTVSDTFDVVVANVNDAPTALAFPDRSVAEDAIAGTLVGTAVVSDPDVGDTHTYTLTDPSGLFQINASTGEVTVKAGAAFDFESFISYSVTITAVDSEGLAIQQGFNIPVQNVNEAPTDLTLNGSLIVSENIAGHVFGNVLVTDDDSQSIPWGQHKYTISDARFSIDGGQLKLKNGVALDYESGETSIPLTITVTDMNGDPGGLSYQEVFTITVQDVVEVINGTEGDDTLTGASGRDEIDGYTGDDVLYGLGGDDWLFGGYGADTLYGGDGNDELDGWADNDHLYGGNGNDHLTGSTGNDVLYGDAGDDTLYGDVNDDALYGGAGNDTLYGGFHDDILDGGSGINVLYGEDGNDLFVGGTGVDAFIGGGGGNYEDTVDYSASSAISVDMLLNTATGGDAEGDSFSGIERIIGTAFADTIKGDDFDNTIEGGASADMLYGNGGLDRIYGADGDDQIWGGSGNDYLYGEAGDDWLYGEGDGNWLYGGDGNDHLIGSTGYNTMYGGAGDDELVGGDLADHFYGGAGNDTLTGGNGNDTYHFDRTTGSDVIDNYDSDSGFDQIGFAGGIGKENLWFEQDGQDVVIKVLGESTVVRVTDWFDGDGNPQSDHIIDLIVTGADVLHGEDVPALIDIYESYDVVSYFPDLPADMINSINTLTPAGDPVSGTSSDDILSGDATANYIKGLEGNDQISGDGDNDFLVGGIGDDILNGGNDDDALFGGAGSDELYGGDGNDLLSGDIGSDLLDGGAGNDTIWVREDFTSDQGISGGTGYDSLVLISEAAYDLSAIVDPSFISDIEEIDMSAVAASLALSADNVLDMTDADNRLVIAGDADDSVTSTGQGWVQGADEVIDAETYHVYTSGDATLLVDTNITQDFS